MINLRQIISFILLIVFIFSAVFNLLFLFDFADYKLAQTGLVIVISTVFLVSVMGLILKTARKDEVYPINIITPAKEFGIFYSGALIAWTVTYALAILNR